MYQKSLTGSEYYLLTEYLILLVLNMDLSMMYLGQEQRKCSTVSNVLQWLQRPVSCKLILKRLLLRPILPILRQWMIDSPLLSFRWHIYVLQTLCWKSLSGEFVSSHKHCHFLWQYVFSRWFNSFLLSLLLISMSGFCKASFAALSAISFPEMSQWPGIHSKLTLIPFKYKLLHKINISVIKLSSFCVLSDSIGS